MFALFKEERARGTKPTYFDALTTSFDER